MLNPRHLTTFLAVVREASLRGAAAELGLSPATVSHHINQLEVQVRARLLRRDRRFEPTAAGARLLPHARALLRVNERAVAAVHSTPLRLGAASNIGIYLLPRMLQRLRRYDPEASNPELLIDSNPVVAQRLSEGSLDMALLENAPDNGFAGEHWRDEPLVVIVPPDHPWRTREYLTAAELSQTRLLAGESGTGTGALMRRFLQQCDTAPAIAARLGSTEAVKRAVAHGYGISLVLEGSVEAEVAAGWLTAIPLEAPGMHKALWALWRDDPLPGGGEALLTTLRCER